MSIINVKEAAIYQNCTLCPRMCHADRSRSRGYCGMSDQLLLARAALHLWEEPCISGSQGSGTVFFTGCTLRCCFCQNYEISSQGVGKELNASRLGELFLKLQEEGANNINLVTATQYLPHVIKALDQTRHALKIPVVYNCGGYERPEVIDALKDYVDIYLPDLKYFDPALSARYSQAGDYFQVASEAIQHMIAQTGAPVFSAEASCSAATATPIPLLTRGVIIRHMVLPGCRKDSIALLHWMKETLPEGQYLLSLLSQYTPFYHSKEHPEINRRITSYEYDRVLKEAIDLGLTNGFMQEKSSAKEEYTPDFNFEGL